MFPHLCYVLGSFPPIPIGIARMVIRTLHLFSNIDDEKIYVYWDCVRIDYFAGVCCRYLRINIIALE